MRRVATDIALIELESPIPEHEAQPFEFFHTPQAGDRVMVVSYAKDREDAPSLQERCYMLAGQNDVLVYSCAVNYGASGSPIFVLSMRGPRCVRGLRHGPVARSGRGPWAPRSAARCRFC